MRGGTCGRNLAFGLVGAMALAGVARAETITVYTS